MKLKLFLLAIILFLSFSFLGTSFSFPGVANTVNENQTIKNSVEGYRYERVFIDGKWWIIVYDEDGYIVNIYEDEE